jgi:DNA topoisomerase-2
MELDALLKQTPEDIWNIDLDAFMARFDLLERELEDASLASARKVKGSKGGFGKKATKAKPKKAVRKGSGSSEESEDAIQDDSEDDFEDEDGDFAMARKPAAKPAAAKKPVVAGVVPVAKPAVVKESKPKTAVVPKAEPAEKREQV